MHQAIGRDAGGPPCPRSPLAPADRKNRGPVASSGEDSVASGNGIAVTADAVEVDAVFPTLKTKDQVTQHIKEYLLKDGRDLPALISTALKAATSGLTAGIAQSTLVAPAHGA